MVWCCFVPRLAIEENLTSHESLHRLSSLKNIKPFSYAELREATNNFHSSRKLGQGGFGRVYKGTLRNGTLLAAKVLSAESSQGMNQFLTEIDMISNVQHPNLVKLIGFCFEGRNTILVYEYLENNSLDHALQGLKGGNANFSWEMRGSTCIGTAKGLKFLHEDLQPHIVHRDIKASNILLDINFMPKIGDFGFAKLFPNNVTHISTRVAGTMILGTRICLAGPVDQKADIYSFGVVVLEIVSGKRAAQMDLVLVQWAWQLYEENRLKDLVDPSLENYPEEEVMRFIKVALFCTQEIAARRPSMSQIVEMLSKPVWLNEEELSPPKSIISSMRSFPKSKAGKFKVSPTSTAAQFVPTNLTFSEFLPR